MTIHPPHSHSDQLPLTGKKAVVTGSSHGIGRAMAYQFAEAGAELVIHGCHHLDAAEEVVNSIRQFGGKAYLRMIDLTLLETENRLNVRLFPALDWLTSQGTLADRFVLYGESLGTADAVQMVDE